MKGQALISNQAANSIIKICFDAAEFSRLYEQDDRAIQIFQCNDDIKKALKWLISSKNTQEMYSNARAYIQATQNTLKVYNNLNISFNNKEKIIATLRSLQSNLTELQNQIHIK